ncbi:MAG: MFS transporter [Planctomycetota bacterium]|jgi:MFS family permease
MEPARNIPIPGSRQKNGRTRKFFDLWFKHFDLNDIERGTFRKQILGGVLYGMFFSILHLGGYLLRYQMNASHFQVTFYMACTMSVFVFSTVGSSYLTWHNHRKLMLLYAIFGPPSLIVLIFYSHTYFFIALIVWVQLSHALFLPGQNMIFRSNYRTEVRGVCYARAQVVRLAIVAVAGGIIGYILKLKPDYFTYAFAIGGILGAAGYIFFVIMPVNPELENRPLPLPGSKANPFGDFFRIMKKDRFFRNYELFFMIYGIAFMMTYPLVPLFVNDVLHANPEQAAYIFVVIQSVVMIIFLPLFGRLLDKTNAVPVAALAFLCLAFWPLSLSLADSIIWVYTAYFFFGLGMAGVDLAWMLGAQTFAGEDDIQGYHAVHVTMVGLRGALVPFMGLGLQKVIGFYATFATAGGLFLIAAGSMLVLNRMRRNALLNR